MDGNKKKRSAFTAKDIVVIAILAGILFVQEEALTFLPNVQLTVFLLVLYSKKLGFLKTCVMIVIHVLLDNIIMGSFNPVVTPAMFVGWMFVPILICTIGKKTEKPLFLALIATLCAFLYSWSYVLPMWIFYHMKPLIYLINDVVFELILAGVSFVTVFLLYKPCARLFKYL